MTVLGLRNEFTTVAQCGIGISFACLGKMGCSKLCCWPNWVENQGFGKMGADNWKGELNVGFRFE